MEMERDWISKHFGDFVPPNQQWFSPKEVAAIIGRSDQFVRNSFYSGKIMGHMSNGLARKGEEKKSYLRVHRDAILMYLLESANYTPDTFMEGIEQLLQNRSQYQLMRLEKMIRERLYGKKFVRAK